MRDFDLSSLSFSVWKFFIKNIFFNQKNEDVLIYSFLICSDSPCITCSALKFRH